VTDKEAERVLVVPTRMLRELGLFHGLCTRWEDYLPALLDPAHLDYRPRGEVETDPSFKQLIPYVILRWREQVFHYTRGKQGTEKRLQALRSVGIGGHISAEDAAGAADPYRAGMLREVAEEVHLESGYSESCLGLINDDRTPVGQVHLGIVHVFDLEAPEVRRREEGIAEAGFAPLAQLRTERDQFETWSQFVLEVLEGSAG
jgi:predicted NUDIX family phosphoesterase